MAFPEEYKLKWADFPQDEYESRVRRAQELMAEDGLDVVVLTSGENVEYFSGFQNGHWNSKSFPTGALLLHRTKNPVLIIPRFFSGTAWSSSWVDEYAIFPEPHAAPRDFGRVLVDAVRNLGGATAVVGFERGTHLSPGWNFDDLIYVTEHLVSGEMRSAARVIWGCRMIKSAREMDRMRWLTKIADESITAARNDLALGQTEREVGNRIAVEIMARGGDDTSFRNIRAGSDRYHCSDSLPQDRAFIDGDLLIIDTGAKYGQYVTDVAYTTLLGTATDRHREVYDITVRAQEAAVAKCRPGVPAKEVFLAAARVIEESGLTSLDMIGHGIGMDLHEPIMLTPYNDEVLQEGMVLAVEPWLYDPSGLGVFALEEHVIVTADDPEMLSSIPRDELLEVR
ncbi:Xaa-Pro dipeptidase PepQ [Microbacterium pseudoresistens]|uniref:Xaa-Pro aminopeptidase n=1 Tax=Microbacterium pseudoresistens TaxID=640634 RepID=A0A7Y9EVA9_9MICO|nr:Xaa-Pro peptidase family protein [Microbacterium pseudoresistens]NYD54628.1 Xaa-Pro aminopeptidase [Microbacterium pseudoresistens]